MCFLSSFVIASCITCSYVGLAKTDGTDIVRALSTDKYDVDTWQVGPLSVIC